MGLFDKFGQKRPEPPRRAAGPALQASYDALLAAIADGAAEKTVAQLERFFGLLRASQEAMRAGFPAFTKLAVSRSTRFAILERSDLGVFDHEHEHSVFAILFGQLVDDPVFEAEAANHPEACEEIGISLAVRLVHFLGNRRLGPFKETWTMLALFLTSGLRGRPLAEKLFCFQKALWELIPADDPAPWQDILGAPRDIRMEELELPPALEQAVAALRRERELADRLLELLPQHEDMTAVRKMREIYLDSLREATGKKDPSAFCDRFALLHLIAPAGRLAMPALLLWYLEPGETRSQLPARVSGRNLFAGVRRTENLLQISVQNLNSYQWLEGYHIALTPERLAAIAQGLQRSGGRYLVAVVRMNEPLQVRCAWIQTGSLDLTGKLIEAYEALGDGTARAEVLLQEAAQADPFLGNAYRQLSMEKRNRSKPGEYAEAREDLVRELRRDPGSGRAQASLGILAKREDDLAEAAELLERSLELRPHALDHLLTLAATYLSMGPDHLERFLELCARAYELDPQSQETASFLTSVSDTTGIDVLAYAKIAAADTRLY